MTTKFIPVRATTELHQAVQAAAQAEGLTTSAFIRRVLTVYLAQHPMQRREGKMSTTMDMDTGRGIRIGIIVREPDLREFLSMNEEDRELPESLVDRRMDAYVAEAERRIRRLYPEANVTVAYGDTPMDTIYRINDEFNPTGGEEFVVREYCENVFAEMVNDWDWCPDE